MAEFGDTPPVRRKGLIRERRALVDESGAWQPIISVLLQSRAVDRIAAWSLLRYDG
jgi:hypothetical protein